MRIIHNLNVQGPATDWSAVNDSSAVVASGKVGAGGDIAVELTEAAALVLSNSEGECHRQSLQGGRKFVQTLGAMPTGVAGSQYDELLASVNASVVGLTGRFVRTAGTPASLIHLAPGFRPSVAVSINAMLIGASLYTPTAAIVGTDGWVRVKDGAGGPSSGIDVRVDGEWPVHN